MLLLLYVLFNFMCLVFFDELHGTSLPTLFDYQCCMFCSHVLQSSWTDLQALVLDLPGKTSVFKFKWLFCSKAVVVFIIPTSFFIFMQVDLCSWSACRNLSFKIRLGFCFFFNWNVSQSCSRNSECKELLFTAIWKSYKKTVRTLATFCSYT